MKINAEEFFTNKKIIPVLALTGSLLWASAYPTVKIGYTLFSISPDNVSAIFLFAGYRFILAGLFLFVFAALTGRFIVAFSRSDALQLLLLSFMMTFMQYVFFYIGMAHTTGINAAIVNPTNVFFSAILAHLFYQNDHLTKTTVFGIFLGFIGVAAANVTLEKVTFDFTLKGEGLLMLAAFSWALGGVYGKRLSGKIDPLVMTGGYLFLGGLMIAAVGWIMGGSLRGFTPVSISLLIYMALISSVAFTLFSFMYKYNKVSKISIYNLSIPVFGVIMSGVFLGEDIWQLKYLVALILVYLGIWLVIRKNR